MFAGDVTVWKIGAIVWRNGALSNASHRVSIAFGVSFRAHVVSALSCAMHSTMTHGTKTTPVWRFISYLNFLCCWIWMSNQDHPVDIAFVIDRKQQQQQLFRLRVPRIGIEQRAIISELWRHIFGGKVLPNRAPHAVKTQLPSNRTWGMLFTMKQTKSETK